MTGMAPLPILPLASPDEVARRRAAALEALMAAGSTAPVAHWTQALARGIQGGMAGYRMGAADRDERAGRARADELWNAIQGGAGGLAPVTAATAGPLPPQSQTAAEGVSGDASSAAPTWLIGSESGGDWGAQNAEVGAGGYVGHFGRLQFGPARLQDAVQAGAISPSEADPAVFMLSPDAQRRAEQWHFSDILTKAAPLIGQTVDGMPLTPDAAMAVAHLGGVGGLQKYVRTGGAYDPADANGTHLSDYHARAIANGGDAGAVMSARGAVAPAAPSGGEQAIMAALADPWFRAQYGPMATSMLDRMQGRQDAVWQAQQGREDALWKAQLAQADPAYRQQLELGQLQLDQARNPGRDTVVVGDRLIDRTTGEEVYAPPPAPGWETLSPEKSAELGAQPGVVLQRGPNGELKAVGGSGVTVNNTGQNAYSKAREEQAAKKYESIAAAGNTAASDIATLGLLEDALGRAGYTGLGGTQVQIGRQAAAALGLGDTDAVAAGELATTIANQLTLMARNPDGALGGMPGSMSDADREFLRRMQPGLDKSPEGNRRMIEARRRAAVRQQEIARMAVAYEEEHGKLDSGFDRQVAEYAAAHPLYADMENAPTGDGTQARPHAVRTPAEARALPPGSWFVTPEGQIRQRK